jgi:DNA adenine methylase
VKPSRPVLRYHGGKWRLAPWIISHFPAHEVYVEPYGGAASVLLRKPRSYAEVYNDLDGRVVNLFRVLRDPALAADLARQVALTPFSRVEFEAAYEGSVDPVEDARRLVLRAYAGFGSAACTKKSRTGFRFNTARSYTTPAHDLASWPDLVEAFTDRLRGVVIEHRPAIECLRDHDRPDTLFYIDPPYVPETRRSHGDGYRHEMSMEEHLELLAKLRSLSGMIVISGYQSAAYTEALQGWLRVDRSTYAQSNTGASPRTECLWINPAAARLQTRMDFEILEESA